MSHSCFQGTVSQGVFETFFEAIVRVVAAGELDQCLELGARKLDPSHSTDRWIFTITTGECGVW